MPETFILDNKGFNFDSPYYQRVNWDIDYKEEEKALALSSMNRIKEGLSLEGQADSNQTAIVIQKIKKAANGRDILFVPLQRPWDSVILYFNPKGYKSFVNEILEFSDKYSDEYFVVLKKHPLEKKWPFNWKSINTKNIFLINDSAHVNSVINISSAVALINSGVGVLSLVFEKRVFYYGKAFYAVKGCNDSFHNANDLHSKLIRGGTWNHQNAFKFLCFLYSQYYTLADRVDLLKSKSWILNYKRLQLLNK